ncbi:hypothetical protein [Nocardia barduliensis]|nr:hypothetical protein [Nocardia barduliensis]
MTISPSSGEWVPDSCTLPTVEQPVRVAEFDRDALAERVDASIGGRK